MKPNFLEWLDTQRGRQYDLHSRYINPAFVKMLRITGFDKAYVRGEGAIYTMLRASGISIC
jgi:hypothetical protein